MVINEDSVMRLLVMPILTKLTKMQVLTMIENIDYYESDCLPARQVGSLKAPVGFTTFEEGSRAARIVMMPTNKSRLTFKCRMIINLSYFWGCHLR